ncbi:uncharacterized protein LOC115468784 [Microcaecilia unicolor]|uniref:Uncharacterized protein LOC115468784 n=1 Tax=Microcaecilia unicolor TaxID=1415580 RepID=A0A6P7XUG6_9AMPH|nr:uncharacterized protein LOC115468784 [Microcaecilia unicolor]XP_030056631.1 uncharacterized protein LOC115468784 [Microcaecilia unicolor]XP_030056632.1 uncharacterized protein LOC115468784 [Microcaecilia unicolor]XP_030056633.1 uncharacterized protein LOC115468784 [Microcaecilia unicolor]
MAVYANKNSMFSIQEAVLLLKNANITKAVRKAATNAKPGEAYLFTYAGNEEKKDDWRADGYAWFHGGLRRWPKTDPVLRKTYHRIRTGNGNFHRYSYQLLESGSTEILVHYLGEQPTEKSISHGNRLRNIDREHIRSAPSLLKRIRMEKGKPMSVYRRICNEGTMEDIAGTLPRDVEQVKNQQKYKQRKECLIQDDIYNVFEYCDLLGQFVWSYTLHPDVLVMMGDRKMATLFEDLTRSVKDKPILVSYDTTFNLGDYYLSSVVFQHELFKESPVIPLCFMLHTNKKFLTYWAFLHSFKMICHRMENKNVIFASDSETSIQEAIDHVFPTVKRVVYWNYIRQDLKVWIKKHGGTNSDSNFYLDEIVELLKCNTKQIFHEKLRLKRRNWSKAFLQYYEQELHESIIYHASSWILEKNGIVEYVTGITTSISESFNSILKRVVEQQEIQMACLVMCLYHLQNYYVREIINGQCHLGNYHLKDIYRSHSKDKDTVTLPKEYCTPEDIEKFIRLHSDSNTSKSKMEPPPSACNIAEGQALIKRQSIVLLPSLGIFVVQGHSGDYYNVRLFPEEKCSCNSTRTCLHILGARDAVGMPPPNIGIKTINLTTLARNRRRKARSGRKFPC